MRTLFSLTIFLLYLNICFAQDASNFRGNSSTIELSNNRMSLPQSQRLFHWDTVPHTVMSYQHLLAGVEAGAGVSVSNSLLAPNGVQSLWIVSDNDDITRMYWSKRSAAEAIQFFESESYQKASRLTVLNASAGISFFETNAGYGRGISIPIQGYFFFCNTCDVDFGLHAATQYIDFYAKHRSDRINSRYNFATVSAGVAAQFFQDLLLSANIGNIFVLDNSAYGRAAQRPIGDTDTPGSFYYSLSGLLNIHDFSVGSVTISPTVGGSVQVTERDLFDFTNTASYFYDATIGVNITL